jgi:hypothetical protein
LSTTTMHRLPSGKLVLSSGKLVSERIVELLDEVRQRGLVPAEIILGRMAIVCLRSEGFPDLPLVAAKRSFFEGIEVFESSVEAAEYVGIDAHY